MIKVKLTLPFAQIPERANPTDAGADLFVPDSFIVNAHSCSFVNFGIQLEIPDGYCGMIFARSGLGSKQGIRPRNCVGVIDSKYRGDIGMMVENDGDNDMFFNRGSRIAQLVIVPINTCDFVVADELDSYGDRGGGFGHTGN